MLRGRAITLAGAIAVAATGGVLARQQSAPAAANAPPVAAASGLRFERIPLSTGVELHVAQHGPADGRPVLFLHGVTDSWFSYSRILDGLPPEMRAIVPSQRGHGDSERPECCYRIADLARDAVALLDALGVERAHVVGHSTGSFVAQRVAIDHPDRVNRLVLIGSGSTHATAPIVELEQAVRALPDPIPASFVRDFQVSTAHEPLPPAFLDRVVSESMKVPARVWRDLFAGMLVGDAKDELGRIRANTLILRGEHDVLFDQAEQDALLRAIPRSRLITYERVAHAPHWEVPDRVLSDLVEFLSAEDGASAPTRREHDVHTQAHGHASAPGPMPLLPGLGEWHHDITTTSEEAQRYFDQGLRLVYGFNHDEAVRSFERAVQLDSDCALCYWGLAYALGPNINLPMDASVEPRARAAIRKAADLTNGVTPLERALIDAMMQRYGEPAGADRAARDSAYAAAMHRVAQRFPDDADAQVLFADAMLDLRPWNQWTRAGKPQPGTLELVGVLERVTRRHPMHAGACHLYVHAVEASPTPERAVPCAERLPRLMPGAGHIVHMPAHVYLRVGRYEDAARANIAAVEADARYFARHEVAPGVYPMFYAPHNLHFLWAAYVLSGQREKALATARTLVDRVAPGDARAAAALQGFLPTTVLTLARFADWKGVLAEPAPPADLLYVKGMWHYARGLAHSALGDARAARAELDSVRSIAARVDEDVIIILNPAPALLELASEVLAGDIAANAGRLAEAITHFRKAVHLEDALTYDEPPPWYHSTRNLLGEALMRAGREAEAEAAFRDDLWYVRENGWSLSGLERALRAQGKRAEAADVSRRFEQGWRYADSPAHFR